jgi:hypothetical protein
MFSLRKRYPDQSKEQSFTSKSVTSGQESYTRTNVITRYAMLTFTYNLNNFADTKQKRMPGFLPRGGDRGNRDRF